MTKDPGDILLRRYLEGSCTESEQKKIELWLQEDSSHADRLERFVEEHTDLVDIKVDSVRTDLIKNIQGPVRNSSDSPSFSKREISRTYEVQISWVATAATILFMVSVVVGGYLVFTSTAGSDSAYAERTIPAGKVANITLSDGSKVRLNSASTLRFPENFDSAFREVFLEGEAFFEVVGDKDRPFKVHTGHLTTTVLGTAFNVKAFPGEDQARVTVAEGSVSVGMVKNKDRSSTTVVLEPNQWATYNYTYKKLEKGRGDIRELIVWKDGILLFNNKTFAEVIDMLERWYGTDIFLQNEALKDCVLHGEHKDESLENVLEAIEFALGVNYSLTDKGVTINGGACK